MSTANAFNSGLSNFCPLVKNSSDTDKQDLRKCIFFCAISIVFQLVNGDSSQIHVSKTILN